MRKKGALDFESRKGEPAWFLILVRKPPPSPEHGRIDAKVLERLFRAFPERIGEPKWDPLGWLPIHRAASNGLLDVVKLLMEMDVDVNVETETRGGNKAGPFAGRTALDMVALRLQSKPPDDILKGGDQEAKRWQKIFTDMLVYLHQQGAKLGSGTSVEDQARLSATMSQLGLSPHGVPGRQVTTANAEDYQQDRVQETVWKSSWPVPLGRDRTSLLPDEIAHSQRWMKVRCAVTDRITDVSRFLAHSHLGKKL